MMLNMMKGISGIDVNIIFALSNQQQNIDYHIPYPERVTQI